MNYYAAYGTYASRPGIFVIVADNLTDASSKLNNAFKGLPLSAQRDTLAEAWEGVQSCIEDIEQRKVDYYTRVTRDIYFFEE